MPNDTAFTTVNFDSNITKVSWQGWGISGQVQGTTYETSTSGEEINWSYYGVGEDMVPFTVTLNEGYVLDTITVLNNSSQEMTISNKTDNSFETPIAYENYPATITLTSKLGGGYYERY